MAARQIPAPDSEGDAERKNGKPARIIVKMNSLCDKEIIANLYEASCAGVKIDMIVRGICCLKAGVPGLSENITVCSIIGNFLEHSRIFFFENSGDQKLFMGSADWMPPESRPPCGKFFPVEDEKLKERLLHILDVQLNDNVKAHFLQPDGTYAKKDKRGKTLVISQEVFCEEALQAAKAREDDGPGEKQGVYSIEQ